MTSLFGFSAVSLFSYSYQDSTYQPDDERVVVVDQVFGEYVRLSNRNLDIRHFECSFFAYSESDVFFEAVFLGSLHVLSSVRLHVETLLHEGEDAAHQVGFGCVLELHLVLVFLRQFEHHRVVEDHVVDHHVLSYGFLRQVRLRLDRGWGTLHFSNRSC